MLHYALKKSYNSLKTAYHEASVYSTSFYAGLRHKHTFEAVSSYCLFVGYPRSGHSLIGSLLDAHPHAVIAHELDALKFVQKRFNKEQIYALLIEKSDLYTKSGRSGLDHAREIRYSYQVPNQWQGRFKTLKVIGDKKGGASTLSLHNNPNLLEQVKKTVRVPIKFVHVIRNPYDNISSIYQRRNRLGFSLDDSIAYYFTLCEAIALLKQKVEAQHFIDIRHESSIANPKTSLQGLCSFVGLECADEYLNDCASIVFKAPRRTRYEIQWSSEQLSLIQKNIEGFSFLEAYSYET